MEQTSFDKIIDKVFDGFKRLTPALVATVIVTGAILFLPMPVLSKMNLHQLPPTIQTIIGTIFLMACSLVITIVVGKWIQHYQKRHQKRQMLRVLKKEIQNLPERHALLLSSILHAPTRSVVLNSTSGDVLFLCNKKMIYAPSQLFTPDPSVLNQRTYVPDDLVIELFEQNTSILPEPPEHRRS